jgi:hypothetical protein
MRAFVDAIKMVPPARIILELLGMPTTDRAYKDVCWNLPASVTSGGIAVAIIQALRPVIRPKVDAKAGCPGAQDAQLREAAALARAEIDKLFAPEEGFKEDSALMKSAATIRKQTDEVVGTTAKTAASAYGAVKGSVKGALGKLKIPGLTPGETDAATEAAPASTKPAPKGATTAVKVPKGSKVTRPAPGVTVIDLPRRQPPAQQQQRSSSPLSISGSFSFKRG